MKSVMLFMLVAGAAAAILFGLFPQWDIALTNLFWHPSQGGFSLALEPWAQTLRAWGNYIPWAFAIPALVAIVLKIIFPMGRMFMRARTALLLALTMALGPGLLVNGLLKQEWGRPRPVHVEQYGGQLDYKGWYETDGACPSNCSFVSGEGALGFWMVAPASLAPPGPLRVIALIGALAFGFLAGGLRLAFGGHFFTDVLFSGVVVVTLISFTRFWLYDWSKAPTDEQAENAIGRIGLALRKGLSQTYAAIRRWTKLGRDDSTA
ncbi:phosphatase PAP2 family protein [Xanthobacter sp. TB0139]|uniref:phosphatase PAP2 family protein n=1 Tax=Xanthobacter sp. TB0139 TaxID=3459178 RepID=UPI00403A41B7